MKQMENILNQSWNGVGVIEGFLEEKGLEL